MNPINNNITPNPDGTIPLSGAAQSAGNLKAKEAAKAFETLFASMMLRSMRNAIPQQENDFIPNSLGEKIYTEMLDEQYASLLSKNGNLGLADLILKQINGEDAPASALSMLNGLQSNMSNPWMLDKAFIPSKLSTDPQSLQKSLTQWQPYIQEASDKFGVDTGLIAAVIAQESGGNPSAVSSKGAKGLMQLMDSTATDLGVSKVFEPRQNILGGTKYLKQLLDKYNGNEALALASYNAGPAAVDKYNGIPPYPETQHYVASVSALKQRFSAQIVTPAKETPDE
jgi:soluble lytic murein transglycosylase-like protein